MRLIPNIRANQFLRVAVLGVLLLTFVNMLYCTLAYEFGWGPKTFLLGPEDRFADVIKLSLSFRSVTDGADQTARFKTWRPIYQNYYEHPNYGGVESLSEGKLTHFHHPPLSILLFQICGLLIVKFATPTLVLYLWFGIYLLEICCILLIGVPRAKRTREITVAVFLFCLVSYPALVTIGRGNYVNAGLTTLPIIAFVVASFAKKQPSLTALVALAVAVNIHPNAIIFVVALPLAFGIRRAIKPAFQFTGIAAGIFALSYLAAHKLDPAYTLGTFRDGVAIYSKIYIAQGAGIRFGSSLFGLLWALNRRLRLGMEYSTEMKVFYVIAMLIVIILCCAYWRAGRGNKRDGQPNMNRKSAELRHPSQSDLNGWPRPLAPFFLVSLYCILSPIFADYHLLVFVAPVILLCIEDREYSGDRARLVMWVVLTSIFMLSPKNYYLLQIVLNPAVLCAVLLWLSIALLNDARQTIHATAALTAADGR